MGEELGMTKSKSKEFGEWYLEIVEKAGIVDQRYPIKGCDVLMPTGAGIIRRMTYILEDILRDSGHEEVLFPFFIPESVFKKETKHIKGFESEVYRVTHAGKKKLSEKLVIRPTSETSMYPMFSLWIRSYQQLPLRIFQTVSVFRYETKMTKPLIRMREVMFFNESHTAHATAEDAEEQVRTAFKLYESYFNGNLGIPYLALKRPDWDRFAGAEYTVAFDTMMPDGQSLQIGTLHNLGSNFAKAFDIRYADADGKKKHVYQTCYGISGRALASLIAIHGDDKGLVLPYQVAPIQIAIVPIFRKDSEGKVLEKCGEIKGLLENRYRVKLDDRTDKSPGYKYNEWELKGVPLRIEIGPRDMENKTLVISRRDTGNKMIIKEEELDRFAVEMFDMMSMEMAGRAGRLLRIHKADSKAEVKEALAKGGFVRFPFCMEEKCADRLKAETTAEIKGTLYGRKEKASGKCALCGKKAKEIAYAAKSY